VIAMMEWRESAQHTRASSKSTSTDSVNDAFKVNEVPTTPNTISYWYYISISTIVLGGDEWRTLTTNIIGSTKFESDIILTDLKHIT
jgi:hypothetical protein